MEKIGSRIRYKHPGSATLVLIALAITDAFFSFSAGGSHEGSPAQVSPVRRQVQAEGRALPPLHQAARHLHQGMRVALFRIRSRPGSGADRDPEPTGIRSRPESGADRDPEADWNPEPTGIRS
jgi:hypothetical protein